VPKQVFNPVAATAAYGLQALSDALSERGVSERQLLRASEVRSLSGVLSQVQRLALLRAASEFCADPEMALEAGSRQRISHFGVYGYALATSATLGQALDFGREHMELAGAVLRISYHREGDIVLFRSHNPRSLGKLLPFVAEFWRSSMVALLSEILEAPFPSVAMHFPYPAPPHARLYQEYFNCPVHFDAQVMEWHFDARMLEAPCPNANDLTANVCQDFCERIVSGGEQGTPLQRNLRSMILASAGRRLKSAEAAANLGLSQRSLFRMLAAEGTSFQQLLDETYRSIAQEYLENTSLAVEDIAFRCGFGDGSNFRKAFLRWTGVSPAAWRGDMSSAARQ
jgi:AraC-like DNA-binding protein